VNFERFALTVAFPLTHKVSVTLVLIAISNWSGDVVWLLFNPIDAAATPLTAFVEIFRYAD
jgi:hypothetical protein